MTQPHHYIDGLTKTSFEQKKDAGFSATIKKRVDEYFQAKGISRQADLLMVLKTIFYAGGTAGIYTLLLSGRLSEPAMLGMMMLYGFFLAGVGFNIGHDAIHGSYSARPWVNTLASSAFELIGASAYTWKLRHNVIHHTYTNIIGSDGDLESMPLLRFCVKPGLKWFHRFQHWYAPLLYCFTSLVWVFKKDYKHILQERKEHRLGKKPPVNVYVRLIAFKLLHYTLFLILPVVVLDLAIWKTVVGFLLMHFTAGLTLSTIFQLGHCVEGTRFLPHPEKGFVEESWARHQVQTSSNFGKDFLTTWLFGGLNFQIEHHLFPKICHSHYPAIAKIVKKTVAEYNIPYNEFPNVFAGIRSHLRMLKRIGRTDAAALNVVT
ncbi:MAG: acyl-CoA desaturase [bacterium]|nr:acyl-CoA desaturase [bacterium]